MFRQQSGSEIQNRFFLLLFKIVYKFKKKSHILMKTLTESFHPNKNRIVFYLFFADLNWSEKLTIEKSTVHLKSYLPVES